ncbi:unnamed protein product [Durusdinium trenchii]|uniref:Uncharacterized protein n=1 Tax=Durusdinium trenchii TaxID=1381693 RepID=A0ABP0N434_9DINO
MSAAAQSRRRKDQASATNSVARSRCAGITDQADMRIVSCECTDAKTWSQREDTFGKKQDVDDISEMFEGDLLNRSGDLYSGFEVGVNRLGVCGSWEPQKGYFQGQAGKAWTQAALSTTNGGLGLRHASVHAPAGYAASVVATHGLCRLLDPTYDSYDSAAPTEAIQALNHVLPVSDHVPIPVPPTLRQRQLSEALDKVVIAKLAAPVPGREAFRAHFELLQLYLAPCVMAWRIASATMPGSRARVAVIAPSDTTPFEPSLQLVPKRPAFTPRSRSQPRPEDGGASEDGARATNGRRPADVWVGNCGLLGPAAFDLAVTSGLRSGHLPSTVADGRRAVSDYEGLQFLPLVAEACSGGWGPTALKTWKELSVALAARNNEAASVEHDRLLQSLAVALQRENARAALRRIE